jgi:hypothetical protein
MSNVRPSSELVAVAEAHDLTLDEMGRLAENAMMSSFAPMASSSVVKVTLETCSGAGNTST